MRSRRVRRFLGVGRKRGHCSDEPPKSSAGWGGGVLFPQSEMVELGVALVVVGAALLVAEAHVPSGALGVAGGAALAAGAALAIGAAGGAIALIIGAILAA